MSASGFEERLSCPFAILHSVAESSRTAGILPANRRKEPMVQFTVNPNRHDPYKQFKFRVRMEGRIVAGVAKVGSLRRSTEVIEHREGGDPSTSRKSPALSLGDLEFQSTHVDASHASL